MNKLFLLVSNKKQRSNYFFYGGYSELHSILFLRWNIKNWLLLVRVSRTRYLLEEFKYLNGRVIYKIYINVHLTDFIELIISKISAQSYFVKVTVQALYIIVFMVCLASINLPNVNIFIIHKYKSYRSGLIWIMWFQDDEAFVCNATAIEVNDLLFTSIVLFKFISPEHYKLQHPLFHEWVFSFFFS